jgi:hypothetical protein
VRCGASLGQPASTAAAGETPREAASAAAPSARAKTPAQFRGLSGWWIVIPTVIYAAVSLSTTGPTIKAITGTITGIAGMAVAGVLLRAVQPRLSFLPGLQAVLPLGQSLLAVALLGGRPDVVRTTVVVGAVTGVVAAVLPWIAPLLRPWWVVQGAVPVALRRVLSFAAPVAIGYYYGQRASGTEWKSTLISLSLGIAAAFLLMFTPQTSRSGRRGR